jgi:hypothetical protein
LIFISKIPLGKITSVEGVGRCVKFEAHMAKEKQKKPVRGTQEYVRKILGDVGINDILIAKRLSEGLNATSLNGKDAIEHPDFKTRLEYIKYILELMGESPKKRVDITSGDQPIGFIFELHKGEND